jgi:isoleucyl-tRNA synthetase
MYRPVPRVPDFPAMERAILRFWDEHRIFQKLRANNANGARWSFLDGPITANNPMGVHHAWGRSLKDMYQRYHAMNGHALRYQNGFDCQGLWVEVEVEKSLGLGTKREIRDFGIENFVLARSACSLSPRVKPSNPSDWATGAIGTIPKFC